MGKKRLVLCDCVAVTRCILSPVAVTSCNYIAQGVLSYMGIKHYIEKVQKIMHMINYDMNTFKIVQSKLDWIAIRAVYVKQQNWPESIFEPGLCMDIHFF